ncbi:dhkD, partial [Symbiodinium microadriaticum]
MLQSKKNFVRYISHEIRTPLNTVFMGIQLARTQLAEDNTVDAGNILHDVEESCVEAVAILNDILLYDKIEDGRMELEKNTIALKMLVKNVVDLFIVQARRSNIDFQIFYPALLDCAYCYVDVNKCSQVVRNIVSNALKFTPAGGAVKLFCKLETECGEALTELIDPSEEKVIFRCEVHDTGPGISLVSSVTDNIRPLDRH